jgi:hypothetical protein
MLDKNMKKELYETGKDQKFLEMSADLFSHALVHVITM